MSIALDEQPEDDQINTSHPQGYMMSELNFMKIHPKVCELFKSFPKSCTNPQFDIILARGTRRSSLSEYIENFVTFL